MNPALPPVPASLSPQPEAGRSKSFIPPAWKDHARLYELDILRFLAAFCVLLFHYSFRGAAGKDPVFTSFNYPAIAPIARCAPRLKQFLDRVLRPAFIQTAPINEPVNP